MEHSDGIDMETFNEVLLENGQQLLGKKKNGSRITHGNSEKEQKRKCCQLN